MIEIYKPQGCSTLAEQEYFYGLRVGVQGPPGLGKTFSTLTFPNPFVADFNRGLGAHIGRSNIITAPFWDGKFCDAYQKRNGLMTPPNQKDAFINWLLKEGMKLTKEQTLIADSNTEIDGAFHVQYKADGGSPITSKGGFDTYDEYKKKLAWYTYLISIVKSLPCNFVLITHETKEYSKDGEPTGACKPLMSGQAGDKLVGDFTDWFRQHAVTKPVSDDAKKRFKDKWLMKDEYFQEVLNSTPETHSTIYLWQTQSDENFELKTSSLFNAPKFVIANYSSILKYKRTTVIGEKK